MLRHLPPVVDDNDRLRGSKKIASFLNTRDRTVQRWGRLGMCGSRQGCPLIP
jgi:hypothetical protein